MSEKKMPKAQRQAWLVGQFQLALSLSKTIEDGGDLHDAVAKALNTIGEEARKDGMIGLFMECLQLRIWLNTEGKKVATQPAELREAFEDFICPKCKELCAFVQGSGDCQVCDECCTCAGDGEYCFPY